MDDPASRSSRPERQMASPRPASSTSGSGRSQVGSRGDGSSGSEVSVARRLGVVLVVATLVGAIVLGGMNARTRTGRRRSTGDIDTRARASVPVVAAPTGIPNVVPVITPPDEPLISRRTWTCRGQHPGPRHTAYRPRAAHVPQRPPGGPRAPERLTHGAGPQCPAPTGTQRGQRGPGQRARRGGTALAACRDHGRDRPPPLRIREPDSGEVVNSSRVTIRGNTEPDARLTVLNANNDASPAARVREDCAFMVEVPLGGGRNTITLTATDALGTSARRA